MTAIDGLQRGLFLTQTKSDEDSIIAGRDPWSIALIQMFEERSTLDPADRVMCAVGKGPVPFGLRWAFYLTPPLLSFAIHRGIQHSTMRSAACFIQTHLGTVCQVAALVSSVALVWFGHFAFGIPSCFVLGIGFLDRNGILPLKMRQWIHAYRLHVMIATGLFAGSLLDRLACIFYLASLCLTHYFDWKKRQELPIESTLPRNSLTPSFLRELQNRNISLCVNRNYIHVPCLPPAPDVAIQELLSLFEQIDWSRHIHVLRQKLYSDLRFLDIHGDPAHKTDAELVEFTKASLHFFVQAVEKREIRQGEPNDYERLETYLKLVVEGLQNEHNEVVRAEILLILAIEAGEYCGPGLFEASEKAYMQLYGKLHIPLEMRVLICLQEARNYWAQACYSEAFQLQGNRGTLRSYAYSVLTPQDVHSYNLFLNVCGEQLGVSRSGANNDQLASIDPISQLTTAAFLGNKVQEIFWREHTPDLLVSALSEAIGSSRLPKLEVYAWWRSWIERQEISSEEKERLREELGDGFLFGERFEIDGKIVPRFLFLMLFDMGILTECSAP